MARRSYAHYSDSEAAAKATPLTLNDLRERGLSEQCPVYQKISAGYSAAVSLGKVPQIVEWPDGALVLVIHPSDHFHRVTCPHMLAFAYRFALSGIGLLYQFHWR